jgi:hypothetical protein
MVFESTFRQNRVFLKKETKSESKVGRKIFHATILFILEYEVDTFSLAGKFEKKHRPLPLCLGDPFFHFRRHRTKKFFQKQHLFLI